MSYSPLPFPLSKATETFLGSGLDISNGVDEIPVIFVHKGALDDILAETALGTRIDHRGSLALASCQRPAQRLVHLCFMRASCLPDAA